MLLTANFAPRLSSVFAYITRFNGFIRLLNLILLVDVYLVFFYQTNVLTISQAPQQIRPEMVLIFIVFAGWYINFGMDFISHILLQIQLIFIRVLDPESLLPEKEECYVPVEELMKWACEKNNQVLLEVCKQKQRANAQTYSGFNLITSLAFLMILDCSLSPDSVVHILIQLSPLSVAHPIAKLVFQSIFILFALFIFTIGFCSENFTYKGEGIYFPHYYEERKRE